jgi:hypothetical protein
MRPDDHRRKASGKKATHHPPERWHDPHGTQAPRSWTSKTMHHPANRIGEIKHGK